MFRSIETGTWDDPKVLELPSPSKLLFVYLFTNRHSHLSGIYYLSDAIVLDELGGKKEKLCGYPIDTLWDTLSTSSLAWRDKKLQMVFVKNMFKYQGQGEKHYQSAAKHIRTLHGTELINKFIEVYPRIKTFGIEHFQIGYPIGYPPVLTSTHLYSPQSVKEQEQEQEQEKEKNTTSAEAFDASTQDDLLQFSALCLSDPDLFSEMPCVGKKTTFEVTKTYILEMKPLFPGVDIEREVLRAKGWLINNPKHRKTHDGMTRFLNSWFGRAQDGLKGVGDGSKGIFQSGRTNTGRDPLGSPKFEPEPGQVPGWARKGQK